MRDVTAERRPARTLAVVGGLHRHISCENTVPEILEASASQPSVIKQSGSWVPAQGQVSRPQHSPAWGCTYSRCKNST